ncbi:uncharacterized protein LOC120077359 [Benincasa hispida]|uniref:uncharacterized protein LOC120077359 n=1 Tax=Benincasa hispida TaxID=102211 RepID=UPI0019001E0A|nr:uncharacterized protein LOC120077359 [Benincasa hispida]
MVLTQECSKLFKRNILEKQRDPGNFTMPCSIGGIDVGHDLCDLGASINLMPLSIFKKLGINEATPTMVTLQLVNISIIYLEGKIEDVLVKVDNFIILNNEADRDVPMILGHQFLATDKVRIDTHKEELTMFVDDQEVKLNVFNTLKFPDDLKSYQFNYLRKNRTRK